jgi:SAM-dependent methyltransferase
MRLDYVCNICGSANSTPIAQLGRESPDCVGCGSYLRTRAVIALLSRELFGEVLPIARFPTSPRKVGIGLSDWEPYARRLAMRMDYTNTFLHQEPFLDITEIPDAQAGSCDFLLSTDVFEHVVPPVNRAFSGARKLLRPGGVLILTVPYSTDAETVEHFPDLHDWALDQGAGGEWVLRNRTPDGLRQEFRDLVFHGGPGTTLEMRLFSEAALIRELEGAGFTSIRIAGDPIPEAGIIWPHPWSLPIVAIA